MVGISADKCVCTSVQALFKGVVLCHVQGLVSLLVSCGVNNKKGVSRAYGVILRQVTVKLFNFQKPPPNVAGKSRVPNAQLPSRVPIAQLESPIGRGLDSPKWRKSLTPELTN